MNPMEDHPLLRPTLDIADRFIAHLFLDRREVDRDDPLTARELALITGLSVAEVDRRVERLEAEGVIGLRDLYAETADDPGLTDADRAEICAVPPEYDVLDFTLALELQGVRVDDVPMAA